jgi:putative nucleotidyltransferase with HDIG domain
MERIEKLPSLSAVVSEFLRLCREEFVSARDFEKVIAKDQALVARLLRVANSGMYGKSRSIRSIAEAVVLVGLATMTRIVYAVSAEGLTRNRLVNYAYEPSRGFWMHTTAVGLTARAVADAVPDRRMHPEEAFVAGLLHDVGKLIVDDFLDRAPGKRQVTPAEEVAAVGLDHAELAEYILKQWKLPPAIIEAVRFHHHPDQALDDPTGARILALSQHIVRTWRIGSQEPIDLEPEFDPASAEDLVARLRIPEAKLAQILWDVRQDLAGIEKLYPSD